jgi:hypothetical protein
VRLETTPGGEEGEVERRGPRVQRHGEPGTDRGGELLFEGVDVGAERRDPIAGEGIGHEGRLLRTNVRRGEIDAG